MKNQLFALALLSVVSVQSFAQEQAEVQTSVADKYQSPDSQKGFYAGAEYMNLTDYKAKITIRAPGGLNRTIEMSDTDHAGIVGLRLGYNQTPEYGFGFNGGLSILQSLNKSEMGDDKWSFYVPQGNLTYGFNRLLMGFAGANMTILDFKDKPSYIKPGIGVQLGLGFNVTQGLTLQASYSLLTQTIQGDEGDYQTTGYLSMGGLSTNLSYTF